MVSLAHYSKVINKVCLLYTGSVPEYTIALNYILPFIKQKYPELTTSLYVRDEFAQDNALPESTLNRADFSFVKEFKIHPTEHVILTFIKEAGLTFPRLPIKGDNTFLICPNAIFPSRPLTQEQIQSLTTFAKERGYTRATEDAGWVIGAENECVFGAAAKGIRTTLVPSGIGTELFMRIFPHGKVMDLSLAIIKSNTK